MLRSAGGNGVMSRPSSRNWPAEGSSRPAMMFINVLFPQPDGPTSTRNSPSARLMEMSWRILVGPKLFSTLIRSSVAMESPFDGTGHQAADEIFSGDQVDDQRRDSRDECAGEMDVVLLDPGGTVDQIVQRHRNRERAVVAEGSTEQEFVPDVGELPDDGDYDDRSAAGQKYPKQHAEKIRPVDARRPDEFVRERGVVVAEEQSRETDAVDHVDEDQSLYGARQPEYAERLRHRDKHDLERNEDGKQHGREQQVGAAEAELGEDIAVERADQRRNHDRGHHQQEGVQKVGLQSGRLHADLRRAPGGQPGLDGPDDRQGHEVATADFIQRLYRIDHHHVDR